jgi:hypothetical protein
MYYFLNRTAYVQWEHDCERVNQDNSAFEEIYLEGLEEHYKHVRIMRFQAKN